MKIYEKSSATSSAQSVKEHIYKNAGLQGALSIHQSQSCPLGQI